MSYIINEALTTCARSLADALIAFAHSRRDEDKKSVSAYQTELCRLRRLELKPPEQEQPND